MLEQFDFQLLRSSTVLAVFGNPSMWGSQNDKLLQEKKFVFVRSEPGETSTMKKTATNRLKKIPIFIILLFINTFLNRFKNFCQFFGKIEFFSQNFWAVCGKKSFFLLRQNKRYSLEEKEPNYYGRTRTFSKNTVFSIKTHKLITSIWEKINVAGCGFRTRHLADT